MRSSIFTVSSESMSPPGTVMSDGRPSNSHKNYNMRDDSECDSDNDDNFTHLEV
jgi:hypothetical protein